MPRELVELLISHGADVNLRGGCDGWTPLFYAALAGHSAVVEFLLAVGASTEVLDLRPWRGVKEVLPSTSHLAILLYMYMCCSMLVYN